MRYGTATVWDILHHPGSVITSHPGRLTTQVLGILTTLVPFHYLALLLLLNPPPPLWTDQLETLSIPLLANHVLVPHIVEVELLMQDADQEDHGRDREDCDDGEYDGSSSHLDLLFNNLPVIIDNKINTRLSAIKTLLLDNLDNCGS